MSDSLGDRMKANYESRHRHYLTRRMPVIVRVDGKAFHTFTRGFDRPFDERIIDAMATAAKAVCSEMQGCKLAYVQSDEASFLLTDYDDLTTDAWFGYCQNKIESITASIMTAAFNRYMACAWPELTKLAHFDARAFNIPREEVANYFLWRARDWERNSVAMYCGQFHSAKEMHGQGKADQHEMLYAKGKNWAKDLTLQQRNGTWIHRGDWSWQFDVGTQSSYAAISEIVEPLVNCDQQTAPTNAKERG